MTVSTQNEPVILVGTLTEMSAYVAAAMPIGYFYFAKDDGPDGTLYVLSISGTVRSWKKVGAASAVATLAQVLQAGNVSGPSDILLDAPQALDTSAPGTLELGTGNATNIAMGTPTGGLSTFRLFINQGGGPLNGSNAGIQYASTVANRAQIRFNLYGNHQGVPGITAFKSRGAAVGVDAPVAVGDAIFRATGIGVCTGGQIPLSGLVTVYVDGVFPTYISTQFEVELNPPEGPTNGHVPMFAITPNGVPCLREFPNRGAGVATLDAAGVATIPNTAVDANSRFTLTVQEGAVPTGMIYQASRINGTSFSIVSTAGAADVGVKVYWQIWGQTLASRPF